MKCDLRRLVPLSFLNFRFLTSYFDGGLPVSDNTVDLIIIIALYIPRPRFHKSEVYFLKPNL